jgi:DNA-binding CsgD family transcriptional regulator
MFETSADLQRNWRSIGQAHGRHDGRRDDSALAAWERRMESEILALMCPDWRNAMLVLDAETLTVAYANLPALEMFRRRYPIFLRGGRLEFASTDGARRFRSALQRAVDRDIEASSLIVDDAQNSFTYAIRIRLPQGFLREILDRHLRAPSRLAVLDVTTARMAMSQPDLNALREAFELTPAEVCVLALLGQGCSLSEIAELRSVHLETVRNQCKRLLAKTRSRRQSELMKLVMALCAHDAHSLSE